MFSHINEAWDRDPVKEITNKLSTGDFRKISDHDKIFDFKNKQQNNAEDIINFSDMNSISLMSEKYNPQKKENIDISPFASVNFDKYAGKKKSFDRYIDSDNNYSENDFFRTYQNKKHSNCNFSIRHLEKCDRCYDNLKYLIDSKINKKFDELMLDSKLKQIQSISENKNQSNNTNNYNSTQNSQIHLTLIIVIGVIIALLILFLIVKAMK